MQYSEKDYQRLRRLAAQQAEIANSPKMTQLLKDWKKHGNFESDSRPMVTMELWTFEADVIPILMECEGEEARGLERRLLANIVNHTLFDDDTVVNGYLEFGYSSSFIPFNLPHQIEHVATDDKSLGHHFVEQLVNLEEDFHKLQRSSWTLHPKENTQKAMEAYNELFGDLLPGKLVRGALGACPTQNVVHLMSMENMFYAMYDYPELFLKMMDMLAEDYIAYFKDLAAGDRLSATTGTTRVSQGSYAFTNRLPDQLSHYRSTDIWGYMDSQETSGLSPEMFDQFIFPSYKKIMAEFGRVSYGCCEAVDPIWEKCLSKVPNLGKVSISPWCNEEMMGERLSGKEITFLRKPSPNLIGITKELDEAAVRAHMKKTVEAAKGCHLEIVQRDVYRIYDTFEKVRRYVSLIRNECEKHQK